MLPQLILPFSSPPAEGFDAGANLGYSAVLQTLLQLQLIIHSGCQRPRRQKGESNNRNQDNGRDAPRALTQLPSDSHGEIKEDPVTHVHCNPLQTPQNTCNIHCSHSQTQVHQALILKGKFKSGLKLQINRQRLPRRGKAQLFLNLLLKNRLSLKSTHHKASFGMTKCSVFRLR